jgi:hypothetical protein
MEPRQDKRGRPAGLRLSALIASPAGAVIMRSGREPSLAALSSGFGLTLSQVSGTSSTVADSPLRGPLIELLLRWSGPGQVIAEELAGVALRQGSFVTAVIGPPRAAR